MRLFYFSFMRRIGLSRESFKQLTLIMFMVFIPTQGFGKLVPESFADLVEELSPAVVNITSTTLVKNQPEFNPSVPPGSPFEDFFREFQDRSNPRGAPDSQRRRSALGSGFIISSDGFVVTNNHVIENADEIEIEMLDGSLLQAEVYGRDTKTDIALLKVQSKDPLPYVEFGDASSSRPGDWVLAIGNPLGQGFSVSAGIISARGRSLNGSYDDFIQTDAAINRGNSGGPLFDMSGKVIGVNTAILSPNGGSIGIGFSMSSSVVAKVVEQLKKFGETRRGWLGVRIQDISEDVAEALGLESTKGALVTEVPDGPAKEGGLQAQDIIIEFDGQAVDSTRTLVRIVGDSPVGKSVKVKILRDGKQLIKEVTLGRLEEALRASNEEQGNVKKTIIIAGMTVSSMTQNVRQEFEIPPGIDGLIVSNVNMDTDAMAKGIRPGDVIMQAGQRVVKAPSHLREELEKVKAAGRNSILLLVFRGGARRFVAISIID